MIFVTVGTQLPFDRLVSSMDAWAAANPAVEVIAQIGPAAVTPLAMQSMDFLAPSRVEELFARAQLVVAHAGMGSILSALQHRKPIIVMPRRATLREHRNDHQIATARWVQDRAGVSVAWEADDLPALLARRSELPASAQIQPCASGPLVERLQAFLESARPRK